MGNSDSILIIQFAIVLLLLLFVFYLIRFNLSLRISRRISKYSVESLNNNQVSLFDGINILIKKLIDELSSSLSKINVIYQYSHKYNKYIDYMDEKKPIDFISIKILVSIVFLFINLIANIMEVGYPSIWETLIVLVAGFYAPDLFHIYQSHLRRKKIEQDLLNAIIMLNNAFKSGRSTMQAIELVMNEMEGPIKEEFKKMHTEISYGLSLETVFKRFALRVNVEEIYYITSSLTILNKTGGNIVKVFSSIERSLFSKRKLGSELKALTSSSRSMSKILLVLPFIFSGIILLLNPTYFNPFFDNFIGLFIFFVIVLFYCIYAFFVQRIMKVRL